MSDSERIDFGPSRAALYAMEAEQAVLGCVLIDPEAYFPVAAFLKPEDFYLIKHRWIWDAFMRLHDDRQSVDVITVSKELERRNQLDEAGGVAYLTQLINTVPTSLHAETYGRIVQRDAIRRRLLEAATTVAKLAYEESRDIEEVVNDAEAAVFAVGEQRLNKDLVPINEAISALRDRVEYMIEHRGEQFGVPTGFYDLDKVLGGMQKSDLLIIAGRPGSGKCLAAHSEIVLGDGSVTTIADIYRRKSAQLLTLQENFKFSCTEPSDFVEDGIRSTYKVTTGLGRCVETTRSHPFLTLSGWKPLSALKPGDRIAVPRLIPIFGTAGMRACEIKLLAYLIGDGCLVHSSPEFTVGKPALQEDFEQAVREFGGIRARAMPAHKRTLSLIVINADGRRARGVKNPLTDWLRSLGVFGKDSHGKFIPDCIFKLRKPLVALFLNRLFATDGWASGQAADIGYVSVSEKLIRQVQHLLLRFGIIARIRLKKVPYQGSTRTAWLLEISDAPSLLAFIEQIGIWGKEDKLARIKKLLLSRQPNTNTDTVPLEIWETLRELKGDETWVSLAHRAGIQSNAPKINIHVGKRSPSRERLLKLAGALRNGHLQNLATSHVFWDKIVSIERAGHQQVYDLTIPDTHNFVANDLCVHNSGFMLSVAKNAAQLYKKRVAIFSLEMGNEQLVQRILSQETGIDGQRLRLGELREDELPLFVHASNVLSDIPVFLDDTPALTPLQLRAKCRRLDQEYGLDLIIVDYLQLMQADGRRIDNRVQEVSAISRGLKQLARELNVPVLAGAQLSRAVEQRQDKRPMLSDLRESGCLSGDSLITLAESGANTPICELVGKSNFAVWALNPQTLKLESTLVSHVFPTGQKPIHRLTTRLGRTIRATANHQFLTIRGWKRLDELKIGDYIALPRLLGGGAKQSIQDAELACEVFGDGVKPRIAHERRWYQVYLVSTRQHTHRVHSAVTDWLMELGIWGLRSYEKRVPDQVFQQPAPAMQNEGITARQMQAAIGNAYCGTGLYKQNVSRERAARIARVVKSDELAKLAESDIYWDRIDAIEPGPVEEVFDLTVPGHHNFVANNIIVHNSLEQDSDIVLFIHRPDLTEKEGIRTGIAEIIVAKHRNGPTHSGVELVFLEKLAKFENAARVDLSKY